MRIAQFIPAMLILVFMPVVRAQGISEPDRESPSLYADIYESEYRFYPGGKIGISLEVPGSLKIIGWDRGLVRVEAEIKVRSLTDEKARGLLEKPPIRVRYNDTATTSTIQVTESPELKGLLEVNMTVYLPGARSDLAVQVKKGDFAINSVNGWVEVSIAEGNVELTAVNGYFSVKTLKGDISANLSGNRWNGQSFTAVTQDGCVDLILPEEYSAMLQLDTRNGEITVDYPSQMVEGELIPIEAVVQKKTQQLKVRVGNGGAPLHLGTQSGDVSLRKKNSNQ